MLSSVLRRTLRDRFGQSWHREPASGAFLGELLSAGQRENAGQLARQLGEAGLTPDALIEEVGGWVS